MSVFMLCWILLSCTATPFIGAFLGRGSTTRNEKLSRGDTGVSVLVGNDTTAIGELVTTPQLATARHFPRRVSIPPDIQSRSARQL